MSELPPGQQLRDTMPTFGLPWYAPRMPSVTAPVRIAVTGNVDAPFVIDATTLASLERIDQMSDFHCATTWSAVGVEWGGVPFRAVYERLIAPHVRAGASVTHVRFRGADGYRDTSRLDDLFATDVLLADRLAGAPLVLDHGAPVRLVAPAHYGYKSVKYLVGIELVGPGHRSAPMTLHHPRARVVYEERTWRMGRRSAGLVTRWLVRPPTIWLWERIRRRRGFSAVRP